MGMSKAPEPSSRSRVAPFLAMDVLREANSLAAAGSDIVHLEVGEPFGPAPRTALDAAKQALDAGMIGYTEATGRPALRERIAAHYHDRYGVEVAPDRVIVTTGSSAGFVLAFLSAFDTGARVALPTPGYPAYRNIMSALGIEVVPIETSPQTRWEPEPEALGRLAREAGGLQGLMVASPGNPTGTMISPDRLARLVHVTEETGAWFISDEIYHGLAYETPEMTALAFSDDAIVINSFSKYYCMTGWRIGWMIVPERLVRPIECLAQSLYISPSALSQAAAYAAFDATEELEARKEAYAENRAFLLDALPGIGLGDHAPIDGAFYVYADVSAFTGDSFAFAEAMLRETGVAMTPGADFDERRGSRYLRMSFAGARRDLEEAVRRIGAWLG